MCEYKKPLPDITAESRPFWEGCTRHQFLIQRCRACGTLQHYPRGVCGHCWGDNLELRPSSGRGTVYTFTVTHRTQARGFKDEVPYVVAYVELEEGVQVLTNIVGCDPSRVEIGMPVQVTFEDVNPDLSLPALQTDRLSLGNHGTSDMPVDRSYIGKTGEPVRMYIERGKIREFARAIKDDDPLYFDEEYAKREGGGLMPPVTFLQTVALWDDGRGRPRPPMDLKRTLHGEQEFEFLKPIFVGDVLTAVSRITDIYEKAGKRGGTMTFVVIETEFTNQRGEVIARARQVGIETGQVVKD